MSNIILSPSQDEACDAFRTFLLDPEEKEFLLSGFAGSGKSFLVKYLVGVTKEEHRLLRLLSADKLTPRFLFTATTNKAANVLEEISDEDRGSSTTVHKMLGLQVRNNFKTGTTKLVQAREPKTSLNNTILVVDEASMINTELLSLIRDICKGYVGCKLLFVGDAYQLPPVKEDPCSLFFSCENTHFLTDIQRQAADSPIISYAHCFRECLDNEELPWPEVPHDGTNIINYTDPDVFVDTMKATYNKYDQEHRVKDVKVLAWTNNRVRELNDAIRASLGYTKDIEVGETVCSNSSIMKNNTVIAPTDSLWEIDSIGTPFLNSDKIEGQTLSLRALDGRADAQYIKVFQPTNWIDAGRVIKEYRKQKDWTEMFRCQNEWADLRSIYAQTVHKSQGSTYDEVFIDVTNIGQNNKWYEVARLMYVAITRARFKVHLFGTLPERYNRISRKTAMEIFNEAEKKENLHSQSPSSGDDKHTKGKTTSVGELLGESIP
jgi:ATP-dependent exoDNAse (exonuclease V) alpha subunit